MYGVTYVWEDYIDHDMMFINKQGSSYRQGQSSPGQSMPTKSFTSARENISPFARIFTDLVSGRTIDAVGEVFLKELLQRIRMGDVENWVKTLEVSEDRPELAYPIQEHLFNFMDG